MKKEFLKGFTMLLAIVAVAFATAVAAIAQERRSSSANTTNNLAAAIPFEFSVDYKTMPAGDYLVQTVATAGNGVLIQSVDGKTSALRPSESIERTQNRATARLVFHRYGQRYFLAEVWCGSDTAGRQLTKSSDELALENEHESNSSRSEQARTSYEIVEVAVVIQNLAKLR